MESIQGGKDSLYILFHEKILYIFCSMKRFSIYSVPWTFFPTFLRSFIFIIVFFFYTWLSYLFRLSFFFQNVNLTYSEHQFDLFWMKLWPILNVNLTYSERQFDLFWTLIWPILNETLTYSERQFELFWTLIWHILNDTLTYSERQFDLFWTSIWPILNDTLTYSERQFDLFWTSISPIQDIIWHI
jgi:hypothetical protein